MTDWGNGYVEIDKGAFESILIDVEGDRDVAFTDDDVVRLGRGYCSDDAAIVKEYAEYYGFEIEE